MDRGQTEKKPQRFRFSFLKIMTGPDLTPRRLALMEVKSIHPGPRVWITACGHGDEVGGIAVIQELFKRLKKEPLKQGIVQAFPLMNPTGFESSSRLVALTKEDLNRSFPGNPMGSLAERIADKIFTAIAQSKPDLVLDLHNDWIRSMPYALIDLPLGPRQRALHEKVETFARKTGLVMIHEQESPANRQELGKTLTGSLLRYEIPALVLELGEAFVVNEDNVADGVRAIWNLLASLDMTAALPGEFNHRVPDRVKGMPLAYSHQPVSSSSGVVRFLARPGDLVKKGHRFARVYNVFGKLQETLSAAGDALVLGHSDSSAALPGAPVMAFGNLKEDQP